jgi:hypothetical protein
MESTAPLSDSDQWYSQLQCTESPDQRILHKHSAHQSIVHPDIRAKQRAYGHSVVTLLTPRGVTTVSHKYSLTAARHATVAVPSTVHYPDNYKIKIYYLR